MEKTIYVECPHCRGMLEVEVESGKVVNNWKHDEAPKSADERLKGALHKIEEDKKKRKDLFESTRGQLNEKKKDAADAFQKEVEKMRKEGKPIEPLKRPIDLD